MTGDGRPGPLAMALAAAIGLTVGIGGALAVIAVIASDPAVPEPPTLVTTTTVGPDRPETPVWVDPREVVIGSTALVPTDLSVESGELTLTYDLVPIAPAQADEIAGDEELELVFPTEWTAVTSAGEFAGITAIVNARRARFVVPEELTAADIAGIRLDAYRVPVPFSFSLPIGPGDATPHEILPGITARVESVLEQRENSIVTIGLAADDAFLVSDIVVSGVGPEWVRASRSQLGRQTWTLDFRGEELPDPMPLRAHGILWPKIEDAMAIDIDGLGG